MAGTELSDAHHVESIDKKYLSPISTCTHYCSAFSRAERYVNGARSVDYRGKTVSCNVGRKQRNGWAR